MTSETNPSSISLSEVSYMVQVLSNQSYVLSLPDSLNHAINGTYGEALSFDLP